MPLLYGLWVSISAVLLIFYVPILVLTVSCAVCSKLLVDVLSHSLLVQNTLTKLVVYISYTSYSNSTLSTLVYISQYFVQSIGHDHCHSQAFSCLLLPLFALVQKFTSITGTVSYCSGSMLEHTHTPNCNENSV